MISSQTESRDLADIINVSFRIYRANALRLMGIAAMIQVPLTAIGIAAGYALWDSLYDWSTGQGDVLAPQWIAAILVSYFLLNILMQGALVYAVGQQCLGQRPDILGSVGAVLRRIGAVLGVVLIAGFVIMALSITIIGFPAAIYFGIRWSLAPQAVMLEGRGPVEALSRSSALVKNAWWRVFGVLLIIFLISATVTGALWFTIGLIPWIGGFITAVVTAPIAALGATVLYYDVAFRKTEA